MPLISTSHHIKASDLIEELQKLVDEHGDIDVVIAKDPEDNGYSPYVGAEVGWYVPGSRWSGEFGPDEYVERYPDDYGEYPLKGVRAIVLGPVN